MSLEVWAPAVLLVVAQGNALYFALSATGLGAVLLASYELFSLVRWLGAAYLIWLAGRALLGRRTARSLAPGATGAAGRRRTNVNGFVLQTANPKALLFSSPPAPWPSRCSCWP